MVRKSFSRVVEFVDGRHIVKQRSTHLVTERFIAQCELVLPGQCDFEPLGCHISEVTLRGRGAEYFRQGWTSNIHVSRSPHIIIAIKAQFALHHSEIKSNICRG